MGVPLLLTWLRNNFGSCVTYIAPRHTQWGRKRNASVAQTNVILSSATAINEATSGQSAQALGGSKPRVAVPNARRSNAPQTFDNLYIDLNSLLYQSVTMVVDKGVRDAEAAGQRAAHIVTALSPAAVTSSSSAKPSSATSSIGYETETRILAQLVVLLDELLLMTNPTSLVYIAVDGVSPKGKMSQQRTRRANTVKKGFHAKIKSLLGWDSNAITSGTLFMQRVTQVLHYYAVSRVERANGHNAVSALGPNGAFTEVTMDSEAVLDVAMDRREKAAIFRDKYPAAVLPPGVTFVINDVRIAGEGEHKIIDAIRSFRDVSAVLEVGGGYTNSESTGATTSAGNSMNLDGAHIITPKKSPHLKAVDLTTNASSPTDVPPPVVPPCAIFQYNPNTTHCIVSPDTDVVVCSLSLHEPHMSVFWYNAQDTEDSQFFSILTFRKMLKERLGFAPEGESKERVLYFEESLHDLIFILLLFGNDFLPKASALTDIAGGQLDKLLAFFVTDFVSRKRHIVDARTGRINFEAARYIIDFAVSSDYQTEVTVSSTVASNAEHEQQRLNGNGAPIAYGPPTHQHSHHNGHHKSLSELRRPSGQTEEAPPFNPFAQGNDLVPGTTPKAGQQYLSEEEIASRCYDYWGGLQWAMLYCTGPCPSWSWQYFHTTVPSAEYLSKYCGMRDDLFDSCFVSTLALSPSRRANVGAAGGSEQYYVGRSDVAMDVVMQLVLLMPFGSRELLPLSIVDAYAKELAPMITDRPFEEIDLLAVMEWCERQKAKLAAADAQRLASFNTDRNPILVRYMWPAQGIVARMEAAGSHRGTTIEEKDAAVVEVAKPTITNPFGGGLVGGFGDMGDLFGGGGDDNTEDLFAAISDVKTTSEAVTPAPLPQSPAINPLPAPTKSGLGEPQWVRVAGAYDVPYPRCPSLLTLLCTEENTSPQTALQTLCGGKPIFTALVTFFFDFKEDLNVPGMNTVTNVYRCGDAASEKVCAPAVTLQSDWSRHRPCMIVGECRESATSVEGQVILPSSHSTTIRNANSSNSGYLLRRTFLLPGTVEETLPSRKRGREGEDGDRSRPVTPQPVAQSAVLVSNLSVEDRRKQLLMRLANKSQAQ